MGESTKSTLNEGGHHNDGGFGRIAVDHGGGIPAAPWDGGVGTRGLSGQLDWRHPGIRPTAERVGPFGEMRFDAHGHLGRGRPVHD